MVFDKKTLLITKWITRYYLLFYRYRHSLKTFLATDIGRKMTMKVTCHEWHMIINQTLLLLLLLLSLLFIIINLFYIEKTVAVMPSSKNSRTFFSSFLWYPKVFNGRKECCTQHLIWPNGHIDNWDTSIIKSLSFKMFLNFYEIFLFTVFLELR